ncbi:hypothetical protein CL619_03965 [archaeon]|nr:hypothetical protein [archaeon]|tara:strand:+ start:635 stop:1624 length:990 start_codon:yes stop_codon:yes gene_type:complete
MSEIKLDLIDRKILSELDKNARISNAQLARKVRKSRETVKYRIKQLQEKGILQGFITSINPNRLGFIMFKVYLKLENNPKERQKFYSALKQNKDIYWMGISDGAFDCVFAILAKSTVEYFSIINKLLSDWKHIIISKTLGTMVDTKQYNKKFFLENSKESEVQVVTFGAKVVENIIDSLDSQILNILANDARIPIAELARKTNSSIEIVRRRMKILEQKGIILSYRIAVDLNKLNLEFFKAIIYFKSLSPKDEAALSQWMKQHPRSLYYIRSLAPWEVEFEFVVESYQQFNQIINELREKFSHVIRNHEHLIMIEETWMPAYKELLKQN